MTFLPAQTIDRVLKGIQNREYVLPAIQREFVWDRGQVARLFDSLMRGYPIGSFLFWTVEPETVRQFTFYEFMREYHQRDHPFCAKLDLPDDAAVTAILDGQQRMTALNIGLRGWHAEKLPRLWWTNPDAFPAARLYLNLIEGATENELGMEYDFRFFNEPPKPTSSAFWFPVSQMMQQPLSKGLMEIHNYLNEAGIVQLERPFPTLSALWELVYQKQHIQAFLEEDQEIDRVLDIFIRTNSGGEVLTKSDLLLSIATAQWADLDAREEIRQLQSELNDQGVNRFDFSKDVILKTGLVLSGVGEVGFKVTNFNKANMSKLEAQWGDITTALRLAVALLADFGLSAERMTAHSVLIPVAHYVHRRNFSDSYRTAPGQKDDRARLRRWVMRTLVKQGIWGSALDTLLKRLRTVIDEHGAGGFPEEAMNTAMGEMGKSLRVTSEELEALVETPYGSKRAFALLALLYPHINTRNQHHVDHVFPRALFYKRALLKAGVPEADVDLYQLRRDLLPNLQLLEGPENISKQDKLPLEWARSAYPSSLEHYITTQDLEGLLESLTDFNEFFEARRARLMTRLKGLLGVND